MRLAFMAGKARAAAGLLAIFIDFQRLLHWLLGFHGFWHGEDPGINKTILNYDDQTARDSNNAGEHALRL